MNRRLRHPSHRITDTGYYLCAFKRHSDGYSGRVTNDPQDNWMQPAMWANWDKQGQAIDHEFGNLVRRKNNDE